MHVISPHVAAPKCAQSLPSDAQVHSGIGREQPMSQPERHSLNVRWLHFSFCGGHEALMPRRALHIRADLRFQQSLLSRKNHAISWPYLSSRCG